MESLTGEEANPFIQLMLTIVIAESNATKAWTEEENRFGTMMTDL